MYDGVIMSHTSVSCSGATTLPDRLPAPRSFGRRRAARRPTRFAWRGTATTSADLADGGHAELTLDPRLQTSTDELLRAFQIPFGGAVVVVDSRRARAGDGRAVGRRSAPRPARAGAARLGPAASVFKVISATALVENGVMGSHPHLLPRRRVVDPRRQSRRSARHRSPLRHAGVRPGQVPERDHRQAGDPPPDRRRSARASAAASASTRRSRSTCPSSRRTWTSPATTTSSSPAPPPASGIPRCRRCTARCWPPPSPTAATCRRPTLIDRAVDRDGRPVRCRCRTPRHVVDPGAAPRGRADDGADDAHRHGQGDLPRQARAAPTCPSRSPARPARCRPRPTAAPSATAGSSATRRPTTRPSRSPWCWATTRTGASRPPTSAATSSASTSPKRPPKRPTGPERASSGRAR